MELKTLPHVETEMLIRRPVIEVFEAFVNPEVTTRFWFTKSSGRLQPGGRARWTWEMYGVHADIEVLALEPRRKIIMNWGEPGAMTRVEWTFTSVDDEQCVVHVKETGHQGSADEIVKAVLDSSGGFNLVLSAAKVFLEHGINSRIILDRFTRPTRQNKGASHE